MFPVSARLPAGPVPIGSLVCADELPDGVVVADEVGRIVVFNRVAARLTGLDPAEVIGKFVFDVLPLRDADEPGLVGVRRSVPRPADPHSSP